MNIEDRKILTEEEFNKMREYVLKSSYKEIVENIFTKYWCNNYESKNLDDLWRIIIPIWNDQDNEKISNLRYLYEHINSNYWMLLFNIKWAISDAHIEFNDYNWYLVTKINSLKLSFIIWLSFYDSIEQFLECIWEPNLYSKDEIKNIIGKYSNLKKMKNNTKFLDFSEFKSFPIFDEKKWKITFRDFANDLKHNDDLLINLKYELIMKHTIKERILIKEENWKKVQYTSRGAIKTNIDDFNKFYYWICLKELIDATDDLFNSINFILNYLKNDSKLQKYFW